MNCQLVNNNSNNYKLNACNKIMCVKLLKFKKITKQIIRNIH